MKLNLKRPLCFFDLETTGTDVAKDRIIEIAILKINPDGSEETFISKVNPERPIPPRVSELTGISDADVENAPTFAELAPKIKEFLKDCDLAGYNSNRFDVPLLVEEFLRAKVDFDIADRQLIDVQVIFHKKEQRTLKAAYKFYCDKDLVNAHTAEADVRATYEVLLKQLERYPDLENDVKKLSDFTSRTRKLDFAGRIVLNDDDEPVFNFGKYKGKLVKEVLKKDPSYYSWMMNGDFPEYTKLILTRIKLQMINEEKGSAKKNNKTTLF